MPVEIDIDYIPQPKQMELHTSPANEILYGGAAGPGKSHAIRFEALNWCLKVDNLHVYLFRRTFPELELNHIIPSLEQFPAHPDGSYKIGTYKDQKRRWEFNNGSMLHFCHCQYENDVFNYQGAEIHILFIDELTTFTEFQYDYLRARTRCTLDIPEKWAHKIPGIICASNPGGVGHGFTKARWVDYTEKGRIPFKRASKREGGMVRQYIPGKIEDNPILMERDPDYVNRLDGLPEPFRTAYKDGDWDIFMGQAFVFNRVNHVIPPDQAQPEPNSPIYMVYDWGFGAPFAIYWCHIDAYGRIIVFREWYGWNGTPNQGIRLVDSEVAEGVVKREDVWGINPNNVQQRLSGHDSWNKKPDYKGGGQGMSTAEIFSSFGLYLTKADPNRVLKIRQFRERLKIPKDPDQRPMLLVSEDCEQFIRTIPLLQTHPKKVEDIDPTLEDHAYDAIAQLCMARPMELPSPEQRKSSLDKRLDELEQKGDNVDYAEYAEHNEQVTQTILEDGLMKERFGNTHDYLGDMEEYDDTGLFSTLDE